MIALLILHPEVCSALKSENNAKTAIIRELEKTHKHVNWAESVKDIYNEQCLKLHFDINNTKYFTQLGKMVETEGGELPEIKKGRVKVLLRVASISRVQNRFYLRLRCLQIRQKSAHDSFAGKCILFSDEESASESR